MASPLTTQLLQDLSNPHQWRHLLRATLRECTYLPDPIARNYMRAHTLSRYRAVSSRKVEAGFQTARAAKHAFSLLRRANEGYLKPLEKVLLLSYGRTGKKRHQLISEMIKPPIPQDSVSVKELLAQPALFGEGWEPPAIVTSLAISHRQNAIVTSSRIRPLIKNAKPSIPKTNSWGRELAQCRKMNIRRDWYHSTLSSLLPPLPKKQLELLDGLLSGTVQWTPVKRRKVVGKKTEPEPPNELVMFLTKGPKKENTFAAYANGRPHVITARLMRHQWRRISSLVPRPYWNATSEKWLFVWDSPKDLPGLAVELKSTIDPATIFQGELQTKGGKDKGSTPPQ